MEQIAAKLASLVPPQPRDELVVEKTGAEKGRETGEARRRPLEKSTVEVKGAGGILVIGGLLAAAAVAAGATIIARRAHALRPPASKKERVEGFNGDHKAKSIDPSSVGIPEDNRVSAKSKDNLFEDDTCNGAKELPNGRVLDMDQVNEKFCRKVDLDLQNGIGEEIISNDVVDGTTGEEEKEIASPGEAEHSVNHHETELNECVPPALGNEEGGGDEPLPKQPQFNFVEADNRQSNTNELIQSAGFEISKQVCQSVCYRNEKVLTFLEEPKQSQLEMAECKSDVPRAVEPLSFKEMVGQKQFEVSQCDLAEEAKSQDISVQLTEQVSDEYKREKEDDLEKYEEEIEEKKVPESSSKEAAAEEEKKEKKEAEASPRQQGGGKEEIEDKKEDKSSLEGEEIEEKKEAEASPEGKEHEEEEKEDKKDIDTPHEADEKDEHEEVTEEKKELESSLEGEGEGDGTHSNQTHPHIIHSEVSTEEFSTTKETDEAIEKRQPASFAEEEDGSKNNQIQTKIADLQHRAEEQSIVNEVEKMGEERQESDSSPEAAIAPSEVVEQPEILLLKVESKILSDSLITSGEVKDEVHVNEAEEKQEESIICRDKIPDNLVHANKAEEKDEQSIIGREKTTENIVKQQLMAIIREKALMLEKFLMDIPDRLLVGFLVMALTIVLLQYMPDLSRDSIT